MKFKEKRLPPRGKTFNHVLLPVVANISNVDTDNGRLYKTPMGTFPSVTTIIGKSMPKEGLKKWREMIGDAEADFITRQACTRGSSVHAIAEQYLLNTVDYTAGEMPINVTSFNDLRPMLDVAVGDIYGLEYPLFSSTLKTAGRSDVICEFNDINTILDFKTSRKPKLEKYILNYFIQATTYALMVEELTQMEIPQIAVAITVDNDYPQIFVKPKKNYVDMTLEMFHRKRPWEKELITNGLSPKI